MGRVAAYYSHDRKTHHKGAYPLGPELHYRFLDSIPLLARILALCFPIRTIRSALDIDIP